jgi:hypothetical protein
MISCTEFIPAYSEGFKFLEKNSGRREVEKFWFYLSEHYLRDSLAGLVAGHGLEGCFIYWSQALNEEAADFKIVLDEIKGEYRGYMNRCPSKGMLLEMGYLEPYHAYCDHCLALYGPVLDKLGFRYEKDLSHVNNASCTGKVTIKGNCK